MASNPRAMRRALFSLLSGALAGALFLGAAWATVGLIPGPVASPESPVKASDLQRGGARKQVASPQLVPQSTEGRLPGGTFLVGAHNESIAPIPVSEGGQWNPHGDGFDCGPIGYEYMPMSDPSCLRTFDRVWATGVDEVSSASTPGRWRSRTAKRHVAFVVLDTVSWFYGYDPSICPDDPTPRRPGHVRLACDHHTTF